MTVINHNRFDRMINRHKLAASIVAVSLLASVSAVSASAISYNGQLAKDAYTVPATSAVSAGTASVAKESGTDVASASTTADTGVTAVSSTSTTTPSAPATVSSPVVKKVSAAIPPTPATTPATPAPVTPTPPATETPVNNPETAPGFTVRVENIDALGARMADYKGQPMHINVASVQLDYEAGYDAAGKNFVATAMTIRDDYYCEISPDKGMQLHVSIPESNPDGGYVCQVTVSDGTVSRSVTYTVQHTALPAENPQPAAGYDFLYNMPVMATVDGLNIYTSKFNYGPSPFCNMTSYFVCESTASLAFDIKAAEGLTIPLIRESFVSETEVGFSCDMRVNPSYADNGFGVVTLKARTGTADGIYACEFAIDGTGVQGSGVLIAELANGTFRSITDAQLDELMSGE